MAYLAYNNNPEYPRVYFTFPMTTYNEDGSHLFIDFNGASKSISF